MLQRWWQFNDKLSILFEPGHARRICRHYHFIMDGQTFGSSAVSVCGGLEKS